MDYNKSRIFTGESLYSLPYLLPGIPAIVIDVIQGRVKTRLRSDEIYLVGKTITIVANLYIMRMYDTSFLFQMLLFIIHIKNH